MSIGLAIAAIVDIAVQICVIIRIWRNGWQSPGLNYWLLTNADHLQGSTELVTIGWYRNYLPAELHRVRMESVGIQCALFGVWISRVFGYPQFGYPIIIPAELRVRAEDTQRALDALRSEEQIEEGPET